MAIDYSEIPKEVCDEYNLDSEYYINKEYDDNIEYISAEIERKRKQRCKSKKKK